MRIVGCTVLILAAAACSSKTVGGSCEDNDSCDVGLVCVEGTCEQVCTSSAQCVGGECRGGICVAGTGDQRVGPGDGGGDSNSNPGDDSRGDTTNGDTFAGDTNVGDSNQGDTFNGDTNKGDTSNPCAVLPTSAMVFLDPATPTPSGWLCVSCGAADAFYRRFPVGAPAYGGLGGTETHAHAVTMAMSSDGTEVGWPFGAQTEPPHASPTVDHNHPGDMGSTTTTGHLPSYRNLKLIKPFAATGRLPAGAIVLIDTAMPPAGFTRYTAQDGYFIRTEGVAGTGGAATHDHDYALTAMGTGNGLAASADNNNCIVALTGHGHTVADTVTTTSEPKHAHIVMATTAGGIDVPFGMMALFDAAPGMGWNVLSGAGGILENDFLEAQAIPDFNDFGVDTHQPATYDAVSGGPSTTVLARGQPGCMGGALMRASATHTHLSSVSFDVQNHRPPYRDAIIAKLVSCN